MFEFYSPRALINQLQCSSTVAPRTEAKVPIVVISFKNIAKNKKKKKEWVYTRVSEKRIDRRLVIRKTRAEGVKLAGLGVGRGKSSNFHSLWKRRRRAGGNGFPGFVDIPFPDGN